MELDLSTGRISLVIVPTDLRFGYFRLAKLATEYLHIDVTAGHDWVVFISRTREVAKIIHCDEHGSVMVTRRLHKGRYQRLMERIDGPVSRSLCVSELKNYLNGGVLEVNRDNYVYG